MEMLKDFDISPFKKMKPPSNSGYTTHTELNELKKIPLKKSFVKKFDNIETAFAKTAKDNNIKDYDKSIAAKLIKESAPVILKLKKYHNRPRPKDLDKNFWLPILQDKRFSDWVQKRYTIGSVEMMGEEVSDEDVQQEYDKV